MLEEGIPAMKFNFSNDQIKQVHIRLKSNRKAFEYITLDDSKQKKGCCFKIFGQTRTCQLKDFNGVVFGGQTMSFGRHKGRLIKLLKSRQHNKSEDKTVKGIDQMQKNLIVDSEETTEFHAWQCISLLRCYSSLDFMIKEENHMTAFFQVAWAVIYAQQDSQFMSVFRKLKFKMKLGYFCW